MRCVAFACAVVCGSFFAALRKVSTSPDVADDAADVSGRAIVPFSFTARHGYCETSRAKLAKTFSAKLQGDMMSLKHVEVSFT